MKQSSPVMRWHLHDIGHFARDIGDRLKPARIGPDADEHHDGIAKRAGRASAGAQRSHPHILQPLNPLAHGGADMPATLRASWVVARHGSSMQMAQYLHLSVGVAERLLGYVGHFQFFLRSGKKEAGLPLSDHRRAGNAA